MNYLEFLKKVHEIRLPDVYFEIGVRRGASLSLAKKTAIAIDPSYSITERLSNDAHLFKTTSDEFFASDAMSSVLNGRKIDMAFIDGWHNFEYVLRDFINTEAWCGLDSVIVIDDVKPRNIKEASRTPTGGAWTGDVWKIGECLRLFRSDLDLMFVSTSPTGVLVIKNLNPLSDVLRKAYVGIEKIFVNSKYPAIPANEYYEQFIDPGVALDRLR